MKSSTVVMGVLNDIHHLALLLIGGALSEAGFKPVYLGTHLAQEDFVSAALETNAAAIFVSQSCGHALIDAPGLREKCIEAGIGNIIIYLGGSTLIRDPAGEWKWEDIEKTFQKAGYTRVYPQEVSVQQIINDLKSDLQTQANRGEV